MILAILHWSGMVLFASDVWKKVNTAPLALGLRHIWILVDRLVDNSGLLTNRCTCQPSEFSLQLGQNSFKKMDSAMKHLLCCAGREIDTLRGGTRHAFYYDSLKIYQLQSTQDWGDKNNNIEPHLIFAALHPPLVPCVDYFFFRESADNLLAACPKKKIVTSPMEDG